MSLQDPDKRRDRYTGELSCERGSHSAVWWHRVRDALVRISWPKFVMWIMLWSTCLHCVAAWAVSGVAQCDEHCQTVEWAAVLLGLTDVQDLPWEYGAKLRPWLQPMLYAGILQLWDGIFGLTDPWVWARILRFFGALLSLSTLMWPMRWLVVWAFPDKALRRVVFGTSALFYATPMLAARTSSENLAQSVLIWGLAWLVLALNKESRSGWIRFGLGAGLAFGVATIFRFPVGSAVLPAMLWLLWQRRLALWAVVSLGGLSAVALCSILDRIGYGVWAFPAWNFIAFNGGSEAGAHFGSTPFYGFFMLLMKDILPPFGPLWGLILLAAFFFQRRHLVTWMVVGFFLFHSFAEHKEARFMMPIVHLSVLLAGLIWQEGRVWKVLPARGRRWFAASAPWVVSIGIGVNAVGWIVRMPRPRQWQSFVGMQMLQKHVSGPFILYTDRHDPTQICGLRTGFYMREEYRMYNIWGQSIEFEMDSNWPTLLLRGDRDLKPPQPGVLEKCTLLESRSYYSWAPKWISQSTWLELYRCDEDA